MAQIVDPDAGKSCFFERGVDVVAVATGPNQALAKTIRLAGLHPHAGGGCAQFVAAHALWPTLEDPLPGGAEMAATRPENVCVQFRSGLTI